MSIKFKDFKQDYSIDFKDYKTQEGETRYYITPDGKFPSMTSMLKLLDDGGLQQWVDRVGKDEANKIVQEAGARGNALHDMIELYLQNRLTRKDVKGQAGILFNRMKRYLDEIDLVYGTEVALYNKQLGYAGRTDAIGEAFGHTCIIDHKNSRKPINLELSFNRRKLFKYQLQTVGYAKALEAMYGLKATHGFITVGNHLNSNADRFFFKLAPYEKEFELLLKAYHEDKDFIKESLFFQL